MNNKIDVKNKYDNTCDQESIFEIKSEISEIINLKFLNGQPVESTPVTLMNVLSKQPDGWIDGIEDETVFMVYVSDVYCGVNSKNDRTILQAIIQYVDDEGPSIIMITFTSDEYKDSDYNNWSEYIFGEVSKAVDLIYG